MILDYYCDHNVCPFIHDGWCSYWDSSTELMKNRGTKCSFDNSTYDRIDEVMQRCFRWK